MSSRSIGLLLIVSACVLSFALGMKAQAAEPERIEDLQPPAVAMTIERKGEELVAIKVYDLDGKNIATLRPDGTVETEGEPGDAAKAFWYALSGYIKQCSKL